MTVAITINEQAVWPPRTQVVLTGLTVGDSVTVYRVVAGQRTEIRGAVDAVADTSLVLVDAELPFGVPVSYVAVVEGTNEYASSGVTYALPGGKVAITDAISGLAAEVLLLADGGKTYARNSARMRVGGRNVVVTNPSGQAEGSYELLTETSTALENLQALLAGSTEATVQIRQPGAYAPTGDPYDGVDAYLTVDQWVIDRVSQDGSDPKRKITIQYAETEGWSLALLTRAFTYQNVQDAYPSATYQDLLTDFPTYLDFVQGDFS